MKRKSLAIAVAGFAIVGLSACGSSTVAQPADPVTTEPAAEQPPEEAMTVEDAPEEEAVPDTGVEGARAFDGDLPIFAFGDDATFDAGQGLTVSYVEESTLSEYGAGDCSPGDAVSIFKVSVKNEPGSMWEPYMDMEVMASYEDDETGEVMDASDVFDDWGSKSLDAGQSLPKLMDGKSGSSYWGFCHPGGSADSVTVIGTFYDEYGETPGIAMWAASGSELFD